MCDIPLVVKGAAATAQTAFARILHSHFVLADAAPARAVRSGRRLELTLGISAQPGPRGEVVFQASDFAVYRSGNCYHLRSGDSWLVLDVAAGRAEGSLSEAFFASPAEVQRGLLTFALLLLLSGQELCAVHAAGVWHEGRGYLLAGASGAGKTTLTGALVRSGWQYLCDDSALLRRGPAGLEAVAFSRAFHCSPAMFGHFPELSQGLRAAGRESVQVFQAPVFQAPVFQTEDKRLVTADSVYPGRFRNSIRPEVVLFPEISGEPNSRLIPLDCTATMLRLLGQGVGLLHGAPAMTAQMQLLGELAQIVRGYRLLHGADVHRNPARVAALLQGIPREGGATGELRSAA